MKKLLLYLFWVIPAIQGFAQPLNNEWIDYSKTYYKFSVGASGLLRITQPVLASAGLGSTPVQQFQLWRNGVEVPLFTSQSTGVLLAAGFIECYGQPNDGTADTRLYRYDSLQMSSRWSLYTDTAAYFLTVNSATANKRYNSANNNLTGNTLAPEPYFMYRLERFYKDRMNAGYGIELTELVHSASYETAEGWTGEPILSGAAYSDKNSNLRLYGAGTPATLDITLCGNTKLGRTASVRLNNQLLASRLVSGFNIARLSVGNIALNTFTGDSATLSISHNGNNDHILVAAYALTYPRQFSFGNQSQFYFELPGGTPRYLEISDFNTGGATPVLLDTANDIRMLGDVFQGKVRFLLPAVSDVRKMFLLSGATAAVQNVARLTTRTFTDYALPANQGDYLVVSHPSLYTDLSGVNQVERYRQYRSSAAGGGYRAVIIDVTQLTDQFAFGIKHHPSAVRNFASMALARFTSAPRFLFLIGKGLKYTEFRRNESDPNIGKLALLPTFGTPASDNLLTASRLGKYPLLPVGRLSAITGAEIGVYLEKVKQFEQAQASSSQTVSGKGWMKNIAHLTGGLDNATLAIQINSYMDNYRQLASDTLFGGNVHSFNKNTGLNTAAGSGKTLDQLFNEGLSVLDYFGHSSPNSIEFNLDNPQGYNNTGKYPLMIVNGCNSGDLFIFDTLRALSKGTLSEKFVFADQRGSIGYIASTHYGLPTQLNYFNKAFYQNFSSRMYGETIGSMMQAATVTMNDTYPLDYITQTHIEEITLHGDPALRLNPHAAPDLLVQDSLVSFSPDPVTAADNRMTLKVRVMNIGRAVKDSVVVRMERKRPDGTTILIGSDTIGAGKYMDSVQALIELDPAVDTGLQQIVVTVDPENRLAELSKLNNRVVREFRILEDQVRPLYPPEYAIVGSPDPLLSCYTVNPLAPSREYVMEMDTTLKFNSPLKILRKLSSKGGLLRFVPGIALRDSTVYYWRVATGPVSNETRWLSSSFIYIRNSAGGFSQSHFYQYDKGSFDKMRIDSVTYRFGFSDVSRKLLVRTGLYPYYDWDQINVNIENNQIEQYGCRYRSLQILVYDSLTLAPWKNFNVGADGRFGSWPVCGSATRTSFEFPYYDSSYRRKAADFLNSIPNGMYVSITNLGWIYNNGHFIDQWKADSVNAGRGKTLWHRFHQLGLHEIDRFTRNLPFLFLFRKGDTTRFVPRQLVGDNDNAYISESFYLEGKETSGSFTSPRMGPVASWNRFKWGEKIPAGGSAPVRSFELLGEDGNGNDVVLAKVYNSRDTAISFIDAATYPYLRMRMYNRDTVQGSATQLTNWMLHADPLPEGLVAPNLVYSAQDDLTVEDTLKLRVAFACVSPVGFDSLKTRLTITAQDGTKTSFTNRPDQRRYPPLPTRDSLVVSYAVPAAAFFGNNRIVLEVNPDEDQPEWLHTNNFLYSRWAVTNASVCPGSSPVFGLPVATSGSTYRWEMNSGNNYASIADGTQFSGTGSDSLRINTPPTSWYGRTFRCRITRNGEVSYSNEYTLRFSVKWQGTLNNLWHDPANWACQTLPDAFTDVVIEPGAGVFPVVGNAVIAICRKISIRPGATLRVNTGGNIQLKGPPAGR